MAKRKSATSADGVVGIETLTLDPSNACVHDDANMAAITESISKLGAGRSVLLDADGIVRAGNGSVAGARAAGIKSVRIIETDGTELIAVKRTDLSGTKAVAMALADNRATDLHGYDSEKLRVAVEQIGQIDIDLGSIGLSDEQLAELIGEVDSAETPEGEKAEGDAPTTECRIIKPGRTPKWVARWDGCTEPLLTANQDEAACYGLSAGARAVLQMNQAVNSSLLLEIFLAHN